MPTQEKSKEAELREEIKGLKLRVQDAEQQNGVLSKQAGEAQSELRKFGATKDELKELKKVNSDLEAENNRLAAENSSLQTAALKSEEVIAVVKDLKSLLAKA